MQNTVFNFYFFFEIFGFAVTVFFLKKNFPKNYLGMQLQFFSAEINSA